MPITRPYRVIIGIIFTTIASGFVYFHQSHSIAVVFWLLGLLIFWLAFLPVPSKQTLILSGGDITRIIFLCAIQIVLLGIFSSIKTHYHQDEFITAYTSYTLKFPNIQWFSTFPEVWISRFPVVFHILQLPFFLLLGPTIEAIRISILPYVFIIVLALDTIVGQTLGKKFAFIVGIIYATFAPHIYLSSMGLHFISATTFYMVAVVYLLRLLQQHADGNIFWFGFWAALCFLSYTSGYAILPICIVISGILLIKRQYAIVKNITASLLISGCILAPFIASAYIGDNFFMTRVSQINALFGTQVDLPPHSWIRGIQVIQTHIVDSTKAIAIPSIGGTGGYSFGNLALLDPVTCALFVIGIVLGIGMWLKKNNVLFFYLLIFLAIPWVIGYIGTIHPPPFHRLSLVYPLMVYFIALPITQIPVVSSKKKVLVIVSLVVVMGFNVYHTIQMIQKEKTIYPQNSRVIAEYILKTFKPGTPITIAAYPSFYLSQELEFRLKGQYPITTKPIEEYIKNNEAPLVILNMSADTSQYIQSKYPNSAIKNTLDAISLKDLVLIEYH